jgi:endonuclease III
MTETEVTNFERTKHELEEFLIFSICVAGKTADTIAPRVTTWMQQLKVCKSYGPFDRIRKLHVNEVAMQLRKLGIGCFMGKAAAIHAVANQGWNLRKVTVSQLQGILGIGPKTARFFVLHSRNEPCGVLDRHVLRFLREDWNIGDVPQETPAEGPTYERLEGIFLELYDRYYKDLYPTLAEFDFAVWQYYQQKAKEPVKKDGPYESSTAVL